MDLLVGLHTNNAKNEDKIKHKHKNQITQQAKQQEPCQEYVRAQDLKLYQRHGQVKHVFSKCIRRNSLMEPHFDTLLRFRDSNKQWMSG